MSSVAIITARGGSKRIPRKNIKEFCSKPIIAYSIEAALQSGVFDEVMVSTDDEEIKKTALKYGAKVPFMRSEATSNDSAMTNVVLLEVLDEYKKIGKDFNYFCCIYPTAPFLTSNRLKEGMEKLIKENADTVIPIVQFSFPPQRCFVIRDGKVTFLYPENAQVRSQDLEPQYHDTGQFYCLNSLSFLQQKVLIMKDTMPVIIDEMEVQDIDNYSDWEMAEMKYRMLHREEKG